MFTSWVGCRRYLSPSLKASTSTANLLAKASPVSNKDLSILLNLARNFVHAALFVCKNVFLLRYHDCLAEASIKGSCWAVSAM